MSDTVNGEATSVVYGANRALAVDAAGSVSGFQYSVLGDTIGGFASVASGFDPYGQPDTGATTVGFGYRGELHVGGMVCLRFRDLDPGLGWFTTVDPLDGVPGTTTVANQYAYAGNDPVGLVDPWGLRPVDPVFDGIDSDNAGISGVGDPGLGDRPSAVAPWWVWFADHGLGPADYYVQLYWPEIQEIAARWAISPLLLSAIVAQEGGYRATGVDWIIRRIGRGSYGIASMRPNTAVEMTQLAFGEVVSASEARQRLIDDDLYAIELSAAYLYRLIESYGLDEVPGDTDFRAFLAYSLSPDAIKFFNQYGWNLEIIGDAISPRTWCDLTDCSTTSPGTTLPPVDAGITRTTFETTYQRAGYWAYWVGRLGS